MEDSHSLSGSDYSQCDGRCKENFNLNVKNIKILRLKAYK